MVDDRKDNDALEALFSAAKAQPPEMSDDFLARLSLDAEAAAPVPVAKSQTPQSKSLFGNLSAWFAASGLTSAAVLGLWVGFVMPDTISTLSLSTDDTVSLYTFLPGADLTAPGLE